MRRDPLITSKGVGVERDCSAYDRGGVGACQKHDLLALEPE